MIIVYDLISLFSDIKDNKNLHELLYLVLLAGNFLNAVSTLPFGIVWNEKTKSRISIQYQLCSMKKNIHVCLQVSKK